MLSEPAVARFRHLLTLTIIFCASVSFTRFAANQVSADDTVSSSAKASLADAIEKNDQPAIQKLLQSLTQSEVRASQSDGMTALHWACYHNNTKLADTLLKNAADPDARNRYDVTPMSLACLNGNAKLVELLLEHKADPNVELRGGETPLMTASRVGNLQSVKLLIAAGAKVNEREKRQQTAIMWAAAAGHADVVAELIAAKAKYKDALKSGFTPMLFACRNGCSDVVDVLLKAGADVNRPMNPSSTGGKRPRRGMAPLIMAVENGHFSLAEKLLIAGANPNDQRSGFTPLHALTWVRKPNRGDGPDGEPAPQGSGTLNSLDFAAKLVEHGADVNAQLKRGSSGRGKMNHKGATAFLFASKTADVPLLKRLLKLGADPTIHNADDCTPLMAAAGIGTIAPREEAGTQQEALVAVRLLLELGADVNHVDKNKETAMHGTAYKSFPQVSRLLADSGAKIEVWNRKNKYGWTPCLIAEGHRPGNFKPSFETLAMIHQLMVESGVKPPKPTPRKKRKGYSD